MRPPHGAGGCGGLGQVQYGEAEIHRRLQDGILQLLPAGGIGAALSAAGDAGESEAGRRHSDSVGEYFQCQDDYLDVYADPETLGKIGTDIQDNKCSWVINSALSLANKEQRKVLDECYGRKDKGKEAKCKQVFQELDIQGVYAKYEEDAVGLIRERISKVDTREGLKSEVFDAFLKKIYKRSK